VQGAVVRGAVGRDKAGATSSDWVPIFNSARVVSELLANKNNRGQSTLVGTFLAAHVDRPVSIETAGASQVAILRSQQKGARKRLYWFEIADVSESSVPNACMADEAADLSTHDVPSPSDPATP